MERGRACRTGPARPGARLARALAATLALLCALPAVAAAHARLEATSPAAGRTVAHAPRAVTLRFDQPVSTEGQALRVFDARGARADAGPTFHPGGNPARVAVRLRRGLPKGTFTATYRVVSADGHIVTGGLAFSIGHPTLGGRGVAVPVVASGSSAVGAGLGVARGIQFSAIAVSAGALVFLLAVWLPALGLVSGAGGRWAAASEAFVRRLRLLLRVTALAGALSAAAGVALEGADAAGTSVWTAAHGHLLGDTLQTRFGAVWGIAVLAWVLVGVLGDTLLAPARAPRLALRPAELGATGLAGGRPDPLELVLLAVPLAFLVALPAISGHPSTQPDSWALIPANLVHVAAVSVWLGGIVVLVAVVRAATRRLELPDRTRLLAASLARFSPMALAAVVALLATGVLQAALEMDSISQLVDTGFGREVLAKSVLLLVLIALGAFNQRRSVPRLRLLARHGCTPGLPGVALRRVLLGELALLAAAVGVTAALSGAAPGVAQPQPMSGMAGMDQPAAAGAPAWAALGPVRAEVVVRPAQVGRNRIELLLTGRRGGRPFAGARQVEVAASLPARSIGPLTEPAVRAGRGRWVVRRALLAVPGRWRLALTVRTSAFDEATAAVSVTVR